MIGEKNRAGKEDAEKNDADCEQKLKELDEMKAVLSRANTENCTKELLDEIIKEYDRLMAEYNKKWGDE